MFKANGFLRSFIVAVLCAIAPADAQQTNPGAQISGAVTFGHCVNFGPGVGQIQDGGAACVVNARPLLSAPLTLFYRTDGNNNCNGTVNAAGSSGNCAFADPGQGIIAAQGYDRNNNNITILAGQVTPATFAPPIAGYTCLSQFTGGGTTIISGNQNIATVTTPIASPGVVNWASHNLVAGSPVYFSGGTLPTGLNTTQLFYVLATGLTAGTFEVAASPGGTAINFTGASSGTQTGTANTTLIDGTINGGSGFALTGGNCSLQFRHLQIKANINSISAISNFNGGSSFGWLDVIWLGTTLGDDIFLGSENTFAQQLGTDWIAGQLGAQTHAQAGHGSQLLNSGLTTNVSVNLAYGTLGNSFVYASFGGRIVYTGVPVFNLNGFTVTGGRCYADTNGIVEQAGLGATFFPGSVACTTATGGQLVQ